MPNTLRTASTVTVTLEVLDNNDDVNLLAAVYDGLFVRTLVGSLVGSPVGNSAGTGEGSAAGL